MFNLLHKAANWLTEERLINVCYCLAVIAMMFVCLILLAD